MNANHRPDCRCAECRMLRSLPDAEEIRVRCREIQAGWTAAQRASRIVDDSARRIAQGALQTVPTVRVKELASLDEYDRAIWGA